MRTRITRRGRRGLVELAVAVAAFVVIGVAFADETISDGDGVTPVADSNLALGNVNCGIAKNQTVLVAIKRNGNYGSTNVFKANSNATVSVNSVSLTTGNGLSATMDADTTIAIPSSWNGASNNTVTTDTASATVTVNSTTPGSGSGTVTYRATGVRADDTALTRDDTMAVTWTVLNNCAPADSTPPVITPNVSGTLGDNGWYTSDVEVTWTVTDPESAISSSTGCGTTNITSDTTGQTVTCSATSGGGTSSNTVTIKRDATAPSISGSASPAANGNGWNNTNVTVSFSCSDATSGIASCGPNQTLSGEGAGQSASGTAKDNAGNTNSATVSGINIDKTAPTVTCNAASFVLNEPSAQVSAGVTDGLSGPLNATESASADTSSVGSKNVSITGYDLAGNSNAKSCPYTVGYGFAGLFAPIDKPNTMNVSKAGQAIPLKWRLTDYFGNPVTNLTSVNVSVVGMTCSLGSSTDAVEEYASGSSGLQNLGDGYYQFNWKTPTSYAGSCKSLNLNLGEGSARMNLAWISFKK